MIRVLFEVKQLYYWPMMEPIYREMVKNDNFYVRIRVGENHKRFLLLFLLSQRKNIEKKFLEQRIPVTRECEGYDYIFCGDVLKNPKQYGKAVFCHVDHSISIKSQRYRSLKKHSDVKYMRFVEGQYRIDKFKEFGIDKNLEIHLVGSPKFDPFFKNEFNRHEIINRYSLDPKKPIVLYSPSYKPSSIFSLGKKITDSSVTDKYNVLIKLHPYSWNGKYASHKQHRFIEKLIVKNKDVALIPPYDHNIMPYLAAADTMISEGSGVINEFLLMNKTGIIFNDKYGQKAHSDGEKVLVEDPSEWLGGAFIHFDDPDKLLAVIDMAIEKNKHPNEKLTEMKNYISSFVDGKTAVRIVNIILKKSGIRD